MPLDLDHTPTAKLYDRLAPYAREVLVRGSDYALRIFADEFVPAHLLTTMMVDEECAAYDAVLFAFADPETIARETLALSPGILVVNSSSSLPFSPHSVRALFGARDAAITASETEVLSLHVLLHCFLELDPDLRDKLLAAGFDEAALRKSVEPAQASGPSSISAEDALFSSFGKETLRVLGQAGRLARQNKREAVSPAHMIGACLQRQPELATLARVHATQFSAAIGSRDADDSLPEPRPIPLDEQLVQFLSDGPERDGGLSTLDLLRGFCTRASSELVHILRRNRITEEFLSRVGDSYRDPEVPQPAP